MLYIIKYTLDILSSQLFDVVKEQPIDKLIKEYDHIHDKRIEFEKSNEKLLNAQKIIEEII